MKVAIFLSSYPVFSETFVHNELFYLQKNGIEGKIWYELNPNKSFLHPVINKIFFPKIKTPHKILNKTFFLLICKAHLYWFMKNPLKYLAFWYKPFSLRWWDLRSVIKAPLIALQMKDFKADLIYVHESDRAYYYAVLSSVLCNIPIGVIFHTYFLFAQDKYLMQKVTSADFVICQSRYSKNYIQNTLSIQKNSFNKIKVLSSPGVDIDFFKNIIRSKKIKSNVIKLIVVCRLERSKGCHFLIRAISLLKKNGMKVECKIIGYGSQKNKLVNLSKNLKLTKEISFLGAIPHNKILVKHLSSADIFVLPSIIDEKNDRDMQPNAVKEAMSMGLLTITSDLGGIREVIENGKNGFLLDEVSANSIAKLITEVYSLETAKKNALAKAARKKIKDFYEINQTIKNLINIFENYVGK